MPLLHCVKCDHEWEASNKDDVCAWCGSEGFTLEMKTALERTAEGLSSQQWLRQRLYELLEYELKFGELFDSRHPRSENEMDEPAPILLKWHKATPTESTTSEDNATAVCRRRDEGEDFVRTDVWTGGRSGRIGRRRVATHTQSRRVV